MTPVRVLERHGYRVPLALTCRDGVTGAVVSQGLAASAWPRSSPSTRFEARRSPLSGTLGWGSLPAQWSTTHAVVPPGERVVWPAASPTAYCVLVRDLAGRYLPTALAVDVPVTAPVDVPLSSAPARQPVSGLATVRGEVHDDADGSPLASALVRIDTGAGVHQTVTDAQGRFLLLLPYPDALPAVSPAGAGLSAVTWPLTVTVRSEPAALVRSPGSRDDDPAELGSVTGQGAAQLVDGGGPHPSIAATLAFGTPLVLPLVVVPA